MKTLDQIFKRTVILKVYSIVDRRRIFAKETIDSQRSFNKNVSED
jgi:hypothetical protein